MNFLNKYLLGCLILFVFAIGMSFRLADETWKTISISEVEKEVKAIGDYYSLNTSYSFSVTYSTYKGHQATVPFEKMQGAVKKQGLNHNSFVLGIQTIQNSKLRVVIDTAEQTISVTEPDKELRQDVLPLNVVLAKKQITACKVREVGTEKIYRVEFSKSYTCVAEEIRLGSDHNLKEIVVFYRKSYPTDEEDPNSVKAQPKATIAISNFVLNPKLDAVKEFNTDKYVILAKDKLTLSQTYKDYQLMDLRLSKNLK